VREREDVGVGDGRDDAAAGDRAAVERERGGRGERVRVVVGAVAEAVGFAGEDRQVVLDRRRRAGRLALPPQAARRVVAVAEDGGGLAVAGVVLVGLGRAGVGGLMV
jgi:hypothetical protein